MKFFFFGFFFSCLSKLKDNDVSWGASCSDDDSRKNEGCEERRAKNEAGHSERERKPVERFRHLELVKKYFVIEGIVTKSEAGKKEGHQ